MLLFKFNFLKKLIIAEVIKFKFMPFEPFINTRSFMEMNIETVAFYFSNIHRTINKTGIFYCVNRYTKKTSGDVIKFKNFPFDEKWSFEISRKSFSQPLIHEALLRRLSYKNFNLKKELMRLKPYDIEFFKNLI